MYSDSEVGIGRLQPKGQPNVGGDKFSGGDSDNTLDGWLLICNKQRSGIDGELTFQCFLSLGLGQLHTSCVQSGHISSTLLDFVSC